MLTDFSTYFAGRQVMEFVGNIPGLDQERVATTFPVELRGVPPEIAKLNDAFKNKSLAITQHDLKRPSDVNADSVGPEFANLDPNYRSKIKMTGHKLYIVGPAVKKFLQGYFHSNDYMGLPKPLENIELVTTAHPELTKLIINQGIKDHVLPDGVTIDNSKESQGSLIVKFPGNKTFSITTCRKSIQPDPLLPNKKLGKVQFGTLESDAEMRGPEEAIYYDLDKKTILDYGNGIHNIRKNPKIDEPKPKKSAKPAKKEVNNKKKPIKWDVPKTKKEK